ncbi:MAG TPA: TIGR02301 family protein [Hyphomicrobium sp.]|nr:TIGR02301 family protein [Hyphomicrobium sp.]
MTFSIANSGSIAGGGIFARPQRQGSAQLSLAIALTLLTALPAVALPDSKPYDDRLLRLSEILGAVHYLRELCGADEGQQWRDRMSELLQAEGTSALRKARLTRSFNKGYQSYSRTYNTCSPSAQNAINRFLAEGATIADTLVRSVP